MSTTHNNEETTRPAMVVNLAKRQSVEEPEFAETPGEEGAWDRDGEERLSTAWQEEHHSAQYEDRYGCDDDGYDCPEFDD